MVPDKPFLGILNLVISLFPLHSCTLGSTVGSPGLLAHLSTSERVWAKVRSVLWAQMTKCRIFIGTSILANADASLPSYPSECTGASLIKIIPFVVNDLPICMPGLPLGLHEGIMRTVRHSKIELLPLMLQGWRSCSVSRLSPFLDDQTVQFSTIPPLLCSKNCLEGGSPSPFCFLCKLASRGVCSAGLYLLEDQFLQLSAARDNLLLLNVWIIKTQNVTRTNLVCCLLVSALEAQFLDCLIAFSHWMKTGRRQQSSVQFRLCMNNIPCYSHCSLILSTVYFTSFKLSQVRWKSPVI